MDKGLSGPVIPPPGKSRPADYIFLLRPMILIPVWTFYLLGAWHSGDGSQVYLPSSSLLIGLASFTSLLGAIYIINQIADRESDRMNRKLFLLSHSIIGLKAAWAEAFILICLSVVLAWRFLPDSFLVVVSASLLLGILYSIGPMRLKKRPVLDVLANAVGNGILNTLAGWLAAGGSKDDFRLLLPYPLAVAAVHLATTLADIEGDRHTGLKTTGVLLGKGAGMTVAAILMAGASAAAAWTGNRPALYSSLLSLPFFLLPLEGRTGSGRSRDPLLPAKASTVIFSIAAGFYFPLYIPFVALVVILTRVYYTRRFSLRYPSI